MQLLRLFTTFILSLLNIAVSPQARPVPVVSPSPSVAPVTYEKIFDQMIDDEILNNTTTILTTGDVIPGRTVNFKMTQSHDFTLPFHNTAAFLKNSDLTIINLEAPLTVNCPVTTEGMVFCGNPRFTEGMLYAGIDVATMGNNHSLNYGWDGLDQTEKLLADTGILTAGFNRTAISNLSVKTVKELDVGILAYNILDNPDRQIILAEIKNAKKEVDFLIVAFHWGAEYVKYPAAETRQLAYDAIDSGADLIAGNHPHWIQPIEVFKDKLIIYAHGNFIFDQEWSEETKTGIFVKTYLSGGKIADAEVIPIYISNFNQPEILAGQKKEAVLNLIREISTQ